MKRHNILLWKLLPWIVVILSIINMWGMIFMNLADIPTAIWVAIIGAAATVGAAIIAGAVALIGQWVQAKRDGKALESIGSETGAMKPKVDNIDTVVKKISKDITKIEDRSQQISSIAAAVESFKYLKDRSSGSSIKAEEFIAQMTNVFQERANLTAQHESDQAQIAELKKQNRILAREKQQLEIEVKTLQGKLDLERRINTQNAQQRDYEFGPEL